MPAQRGTLMLGPAPISNAGPQSESAWFDWEIKDFMYQTQLFRMTVETAAHWGWPITSSSFRETDLCPEPVDIRTPVDQS